MPTSINQGIYQGWFISDIEHYGSGALIVLTAELLFSLMLQFILPVVVIVMHYVGGIPATASFSGADGMMLAMMMMMMMTMIGKVILPSI